MGTDALDWLDEAPRKPQVGDIVIGQVKKSAEDGLVLQKIVKVGKKIVAEPLTE